MRIVESTKRMVETANSICADGKTIGFVPTMGFLHDGHLSLMRIAREKCDILVVSIYVNPTQFALGEDLDAYPRDFERDEALCRKEGVDFLFYPSDAEIYPDGFLTGVTVKELGGYLCGKSRPTHFDGVTTIVAKLFNIVRPDFAVFGQKDAQQAAIIKRMTIDLNYQIEILVGPIVRESDGLAMSSRNKYLTPGERKAAPILNRSLEWAREVIEGRKSVHTSEIVAGMKAQILAAGPFEIDYIEIVDPESLLPVIDFHGREVLIALAVKIGNTRLIDNVLARG